MDKEQICRDYLVLVETITEIFSDRDVPAAVQAYYLLCELIAGGSEKYFIGTYGQYALDIRMVSEGKNILGLGPLTDFEVSAVNYLNFYIEECQRHSYQ